MWKNDNSSPWIGICLEEVDEGRATMSLQWVSFAMIPVTFVWAGLGWWLGKQQNRRAATLADVDTNPSKSA